MVKLEYTFQTVEKTDNRLEHKNSKFIVWGQYSKSDKHMPGCINAWQWQLGSDFEIMALRLYARNGQIVYQDIKGPGSNFKDKNPK